MDSSRSYKGLFFVRILNMLIGLVFYALGIVLLLKANIGYAPWEVFHVGLANTLGMSIGVASIIAGLAIVLAVTILGEKFGFGTIASMILTGIFIDIFLAIDIIPVSSIFAVGLAMLTIGMFAISLGSYFYIKSALGVGPRDNLMVVLARKTRLPVGVCRGAVEIIVTVIGYALGGMVGVGTIASAIAIGFCVQLTFKALKFDVTAVRHETIAGTCKALAEKKQGKRKIT